MTAAVRGDDTLKTSAAVSEIVECALHPRSVAVVGASTNAEREWKTGWVGRLVRFGFEGKVYPINPKATEILGYTAYPSITDVPEAIDYAIVSVPREHAPGVLSECVAKQVKVVHIFTAGFAETGTDAGRALQSKLAAALQGGNTRLIGPNCMGVYSPSGKLTFDVRFPQDAGSIAFISQTGVGGRRLMNLATNRGLRFSSAVSYGNALDLSTNDFLEAAVYDRDTRYLLLYIEGLKDGRRLFELLRRVALEKPVVLLKAGLTESGAGAVASHTASLVGSRKVWQALFRQTGAIPVETLEEGVEQLIAVRTVKPIAGRRVALVGRGGGLGVVATDVCEREGLKVPALAAETRERLAAITRADAGSMVRNPVEIGLGADGVSESYLAGLRLVAADPNIDIVVTFLNPEDYLAYGMRNWIDDLCGSLIAAGHTLPKPFAAVLLPGTSTEVFEANLTIMQQCTAAGVACFPSVDVALKSISKLARYYEFRRSRSRTVVS
jgi:acyl-CoA synthetase (NDP forming)